MDDKTLLTLAAKAAWIELDWNVPPKSPPWRMTGVGEDCGPAAQWNPLTDDGDALRLALTLGISVWRDGDILWVNGGRVDFSHCGIEASARIAITMAAAEIGKAANLVK